MLDDGERSARPGEDSAHPAADAAAPWRALVVDPDGAAREAAESRLRDAGLAVEGACDGAEALERIRVDAPALVVTASRLDDMRGAELVRSVRRGFPHTAVVVVTGSPDWRTGVEALKAGAVDYVSKPLTEESVRAVVSACVESRSAAPAPSAHDEAWVHPLGVSEPFQRCLELVERVATKDVTVLVLGESGVGKDVVVRHLHRCSGRAKGPFVAVSCAAVPESLFESALFGHEKGAFTDARRRSPGHFRNADGGTLYLDGIGELPLPLQLKLLRVIEDQAVTPLGGTRPIQLDVRIVAAASPDLDAMVERGLFRADLYHRLDVVRVEVPPLRERRRDVALLARTFLARAASGHQLRPRGLSADAIAVLERHPWPGNVRQLRYLVERLAVLVETPVVTAADLPRELVEEAAVAGGPESGRAGFAALRDEGMAALERRLLGLYLSRAGGEVETAAEAAGMEATAFTELLRRRGLLAGGD